MIVNDRLTYKKQIDLSILTQKLETSIETAKYKEENFILIRVILITTCIFVFTWQTRGHVFAMHLTGVLNNIKGTFIFSVRNIKSAQRVPVFCLIVTF